MSDQSRKSGQMIAMIPARMGSERLQHKNLVLVQGEPLIGHVIKSAKKSGAFQRIVVNADHLVFREIASLYGVEFYHRPAELGTSQTRSDDVVHDFMQNHPETSLAWVNPTSPLQPAAEIADAARYFIEEDLDSLVSVCCEQVHCNFKGRPLNYSLEEKFARTQDLDPVQRFVYSIMIWRTKTFLETYEERGYAFLFGKMGFYPVSKLSSIIVKYQEDIRLCEYILKGMDSSIESGLEYYSSIDVGNLHGER